MTHRPNQPPSGLRSAPRGLPTHEPGGRKSDAEGVLSALRSNPHPTAHPRHDSEDPTPDRPEIRIYAPPVYRHPYDGARWSKRYGNTPTAAYACPCGQTGTAKGRDAVADLVTEYEDHKHLCTGTRAPHTERRNAA
ncbi:hypothetical protein AB0D74_28665 [Streptomyces sp. NPDC048278]|uniref:hypothetical protein n=1 Tax=Streptomyces sp. NPDC048278 TaxID=3155809 RepID=UPI00342FEF44